MLALIDGDIIVYRVGFACQKNTSKVYIKGEEELGYVASFENKTDLNKWLKEQSLSKEDVTIESKVVVDPIENCLHSVKLVVADIIEGVKAEQYRIFLTGKDNFREKLVDYYKMNRKDTPKPVYYNEIRNYLVERFNAEVIDGQEADDAMSIEQWSAYHHPMTGDSDVNAVHGLATCICSIDKDLKNTPGWNYNFVTKEMTFITPEEADINFYAQLLSGDMTDNIPGLYQITGSKAIAKYFEPLAYCETVKDMWHYVSWEVYHKIFCDIDKDNSLQLEEAEIYGAVLEKLKEIGQLLWMRREENETWKPPV